MATVARPSTTSKATKAPSKAEIKRYLELTEQAREAARAARTIAAEADLIGSKIESFIKSECRGQRRKRTVRCGFEMALEATGRVAPAWKQEFIRRNGEKAAQAVIDRTPAAIVLRVEPIRVVG